jgi:exodeoxyribonuclease V alpha subunit
LHRLLGSLPNTRHFRHNAQNPLAVDVLVIDEASMVDLEMMASVVASLPAKCRLVLLGDKDQLASVEAGAVLGELCKLAHEGRYSAATIAWIKQVTDQQVDLRLSSATGHLLDQAIVMLRKSYRFAAESGIGRLAEAVNAGDADLAIKILAQPCKDLQQILLKPNNDSLLNALILDGRGPADSMQNQEPQNEKPEGYRHYLSILKLNQPDSTNLSPTEYDAWADEVLKAHAEFQVLCALRRGEWGVEGLNEYIAKQLKAAGLIQASEGWYLGRPVMVTRNDYALGLMNGDIGITLCKPGSLPAQQVLRVAFPSGDRTSSASNTSAIKWILPSRLQAVETVYAMTVHKAQGSEFTHTALILPDRSNPIMTRELLYTGITRARKYLTLANAGGNELIKITVERQVNRASGLLAD